MKRNLFLLFFLWLLLACSKEKAYITPVTPPITDTIPLQYGTPFGNVPNRDDAVIYQVNIRAFSAQGNFQGVIARLDSIKALGVNVIYLMPIHPVGKVKSVNSPYCVKNYTAVNAEFGTLTDLCNLVDGAHTRNMCVMLDWVANHTAWDNGWITSHKDWYMQDGSGSIISPPGKGWNDVAQLDFSDAAMRLQMIKNMKYWVLVANVDGFRCDFADGPPHDFWTQAIDTLRKISTHKLLILAEGNRNSHFLAGFDYIFGFNYYGLLKSIYKSNVSALLINDMNNTEYTNAFNGQQVVRYLSNHDVNGSDGTPLDLFGGKRGSMAAFVVTACMKGVPMVYNGQEVGTPFRIVFPFTGKNIDWKLNPDMMAEYKKILLFRSTSVAMRRGQISSYGNPDIVSFTKELAGEKVLVVSNMRNNVITFELPLPLQNTTWTDAMTGESINLTTQLVLQPFSYLIARQ